MERDIFAYHLVFKQRNVLKTQVPNSLDEFLKMKLGIEIPQPASAVLDSLFGPNNWQVLTQSVYGTRSFLSKVICCELTVACTRRPQVERVPSELRPFKIEEIDGERDFQMVMN